MMYSSYPLDIQHALLWGARETKRAGDLLRRDNVVVAVSCLGGPRAIEGVVVGVVVPG